MEDTRRVRVQGREEDPPNVRIENSRVVNGRRTNIKGHVCLFEKGLLTIQEELLPLEETKEKDLSD